MTTAYDFTLPLLDGTPQPLSEYAGQALLIVNVASKCGFTPQYEGLEALHRRLGPRGLRLLGFPCDQFAHQEPGDSAEIASFCSTRYEVTFPIFDKIDVNGAQAAPLYKWLKSQAPGLLGTRAIKWNFTKFLVGSDGSFVRRFAPWVTPDKLEPFAAECLPEASACA